LSSSSLQQTVRTDAVGLSLSWSWRHLTGVKSATPANSAFSIGNRNT
jgi:hypothetical protein